MRKIFLVLCNFVLLYKVRGVEPLMQTLSIDAYGSGQLQVIADNKGAVHYASQGTSAITMFIAINMELFLY